MNGFILVVLIVGTTVEVKGSPWVFQEIKPIKESDQNIKKSSVAERPVKEIDPSKTYINIKEDIRDDIIGGNGTSPKYKEGVQKLLDFLKAGPMPNGTSNDHTNNSTTASTNTTTQGDQHQEKQTDKSIDDNVAKILLQFNNPLVGNTSNAKAMQLGQVQPSQPIGSNPTLLKNDALKTPLNSRASFMQQQIRPPAIPVRTQIPSSGISAPTYTAQIFPLQQQNKVYTKNQIPLSVHNGISKSRVPYSPVAPKQPYNPYAAYQRSSIPYHYEWYSTNGYKPAPNAMATQRQQIMRYPYTKRPITADKTNPLTSVPRSRIPNPIYRSSPYTSTYNFHPMYTKSHIPNRPPGLYRLPSSFRQPINYPRAPIMRPAAVRGNVRAPVFQRSQIARPMMYRPVQWNMLRRNIIPHGALLHSNMIYSNVKYRRMAITDRGRNYNGLQTSHGKLTQETPLPLPLASIMTAARIVVPARPNTLNGALKSTVETILSEDAEQRGARAV